MNTLIHHHGALGDVLLSISCIHRIKRESDRVHFVGTREIGELLKQTGSVDEASSGDHALFASLYTEQPDKKILQFFSPFDRAFVFTKDDRSILVGNIESVIPETQAIITIPPDREQIHVSLFRIKQLDKSGGSDPHPVLNIPQEAEDRIADFLTSAGIRKDRRCIVVHPGSGAKRKCWPLQNYFDLAARLKQSFDPDIIFLSGPAEDEAIIHALDAFVNRTIHTLHLSQKPLIEVAALLSTCDYYIGNDSGITHLASAVNARGIALFGPSDPAVWKPGSPRFQALVGPPVSVTEAWTSVDDVFRIIETALAARPDPIFNL